MSNIRQTIEAVLPSNIVSSYSTYVNDVVNALEQREERAIEVLVSGGVQMGAREEQINGLLIDAGLREVPEPEPEPVAAEPQSVEAMIASLAEKVDSLVERLDSASRQASRHGITF